MRKILPLILFAAFSVVSQAQTVSFTLTTAPCNHNGLLTLGFTGVVPPLTVTYVTSGTSGTTIIHTSVTGLFDALTGYSGGPVTATATDGFGASATGTYAGMPPFTYALTLTHNYCPALGVDSVTVTGGSGSYTYQWYNKTTSALVGASNPINLPIGDYGVEITDVTTGCVYGSMDQFDFGSYLYALSTFTDTITTTPANCTNGTATAGTPGILAVPPYTYLWSNGANTPSISGLSAGTYSYTITDALGCIASAIGTVSQAITVTAPVVTSNATCVATNGTATAIGAGGTAPYSFVWSNGATTASQTGLTAGTYNVYVTDANGCTGVGSGTVGSVAPIVVSYSATPTLCTGTTGTATLSIAGGSGPYSIQWYTTPSQTGVTAFNLPQGNYGYLVTDALGCTQSGIAVIQPVDMISGIFISTPAVCTLSNGSMSVYPTGGVTPYHYSWSNGATTAGISSVPASLYHVTVTDNLGCTADLSEALPTVSSLSSGVSSTPASCIYNNDGVAFANGLAGTPPYAYGWTGGGSTSIITSLPYGPYWVTVTDAQGCKSNNYTYVAYDSTGSCYCTISGVVFYDANGNCNQDPGEPGIPNVQIQIGGSYTYTNDSGYYSFKAPAGSYTVSETVLPYYPLAGCQVNNIPVTVVGGTGCVNTVNFADAMDTVHDMQITTWDYNRPVPGNTYTQITVISNNGTVQEPAVLANYNPDGQFYSPAFVPGGTFTGSSYSYNTGAAAYPLNPGISQAFLVNYPVPTNIPVGTSVVFNDTVANAAPISNWLLDNSPWNNVNSFSTVVAGTAASNFKEVYPTGTGSAGIITYADTILQYMVHFQNTGSATAENVVVIDTLDNNLNWTTLMPVYMSAKGQVTVTQVGSRKVATFTFDNINLPYAGTDPVASNGMLTYSIHTNTGLPVGTQFKNQASIYFDYNAPARTNQTLNTLGSVANDHVNNVPSVENSTFTIYPNPANNTFNAIINSDLGGNADMKISDISGRTLIAKTVVLQQGSQTLQVDASQLSSGVYFISLAQNGKLQTQKLVVIKQ